MEDYSTELDEQLNHRTNSLLNQQQILDTPFVLDNIEGIPAEKIEDGVVGGFSPTTGIEFKTDKASGKSYLQSRNYVSGSTGWGLCSDGTIEGVTAVFSQYLHKTNDDLDDVNDGTTYHRVEANDLTTNRVDIDKVQDGTTYQKTKATALTSGEVDMSKAGVLNKTADNVSETATKKWAGETGADVTGSHTAADASAYTGASIAVANTDAKCTDANADQTSVNTSNDTSNVNTVAAATVQSRAEYDFKRLTFLGNRNDGVSESATNGTITRYLMNTTLTTNNAAIGTLYLYYGENGGPYIGIKKDGNTAFDWDLDYSYNLQAALSGTTNQDLFFGLLIDSATPDADAADIHRHVGFYIQDGTLYASNADGTTQQKTDVSSGITLTNWNTYRFEFDTGTNVVFYVNETAVHTETSNLPSGNTKPRVYFGYIKTPNAVGSSRTLTIANNYILATPKV